MSTKISTSACIVALSSILILSNIAHAETIKLFYYENGLRGWKGGHKSIEACEKAARSNRLSPNQYYCAESQDYNLERRLGWRQ